jgi:hypothetical protein
MKYLANLMPDSKEAQQEVKNAEEIARQINDPKLKSGSIMDVMGAQVPGSYWIDLRNYDAVEYATRLSIPILVLQGGRDYEVNETNFQIWKTALVGHANASFRLYPNLNHLFIAGSSVSTPAEYDQLGHVAPEVAADITGWILKKEFVSANETQTR